MAYDFSSGLASLNLGINSIGEGFDTLRKRQALADLGQDWKSGNFDAAAGKLLALGDIGNATALLGLKQKQQMLDGQASITRMVGGQPTASLGQQPSADYFANTRTAESSGNNNAKNPKSTATGPDQFLAGTWAGLMKSNPELGLTADGRTDPAQSSRAMRAFTAQNADALRAKGIEPNDRNLYLSHFLGAGASPNFINAVQQDPSVPATALVTPQVAAANKGVFFNQDGTPKTAGEVYERMTGRFGNGATAVAALGGGQPVQVAQAAPQPGTPMADVPAQGSAPAGFQPPGSQLPPNDLLPRLSTQQVMGIAMNPYASEGQRATAKMVLDARQKYSDENAPDKREMTRLQTEKLRREVEGEGATPLSAEERKSFGIPEGQAAYKTRSGEIKFGPAGTKVDINQKGESKFEESLGAAQAKRWNGYIEEGDAAQGRLADIQTLRDTSRRLGSQGSSANLKSTIGPYAESLGIKVDGLSDIQLYESITNRLAPTLRAPGSGSTSDIEFKGFQRAIGPLSNTPAAREMILDTFEAASRNDVTRSQIASRLASGEINRGQAEKELRALPDPMTSFKEFRKQNPDLVGQALKESARVDSQQRAAPSITTAEGYNALKAGDKYTDPDGNIRTKR